jgi:hypothetical protein
VITAACHCGSVRIELARLPRTVTECNCSICRRYGTLWAYYKAKDVRVRATRGSTSAYAWGERAIRFVRCKECGCVTHWEPIKRSGSSRLGINARNLDPGTLARIRVRHLDGAATWKYLD